MSEYTFTEDEIAAIRKCAQLHKKAIKILENEPADKVVKFVCPLCGNEALTIKSSYNGHIRCSCETCNICIME